MYIFNIHNIVIYIYIYIYIIYVCIYACIKAKQGGGALRAWNFLWY